MMGNRSDMAKPDPVLLEPDRYPVQYEITTRFHDIDPNNHINNVAVASYFEDARVRFDESLQLAGTAELSDLRTMIVSLHIEYPAELFYPAPITVHAGILDIGRSSWTLAAIAVQDGRVGAFSKAIIVKLKDGRPAPLPDMFRQALVAKRVRIEGTGE